MDFPGGSEDKESTCSAGDLSLIPGVEDPLEEDMATHSSILAWSIPTDRGVWRAIVHGNAVLDATEQLSRGQHNHPTLLLLGVGVGCGGRVEGWRWGCWKYWPKETNSEWSQKKWGYLLPPAKSEPQDLDWRSELECLGPAGKPFVHP